MSSACSMLLSVSDVSVSRGGRVLLEGVTFDLQAGRAIVLTGQNGIGKTSLLRTLAGLQDANSGCVDVPQNGVVYSAHLDGIKHALSVAENLQFWGAVFGRSNVDAALETFELYHLRDVMAGALSAGQKRRLGLARLLVTGRSIWLLDEPTAVLTPQEADSLFSNIKAMTKSGLSVIFISHKLREVLDFSDRIAVLRAGKKVGEMNTKAADEKKIALMMVGGETNVTVRSTFNPGVEIMSLENISAKGHSARDSLKNVTLSVRRNEIIGVAGVSGNGQVCLANIVAGIQQPDAGEITVNQKRVNRLSPSKMIEIGIGRIPEDRHQDGIVGAMSVAENMVIERLSDKNIQSNGFLKSNAIISNAQTLSETYDVRGPGVHAKAQLLSGGNIQKLILARVFDKNPEILLVNQPTRGLDMGAAAEVRRRLLEARAGGAGILLISEDLDEILALADTVLVMRCKTRIQSR